MKKRNRCKTSIDMYVSLASKIIFMIETEEAIRLKLMGFLGM